MLLKVPDYRFRVRQCADRCSHLSSGRLPTAKAGEEITADEKVTMMMAMMDGLRIQALLDPSRPTLPLLETFID